jgi:hypothetical protein
MVSPSVPPSEKTLAFPRSMIVTQCSTCPSMSVF